MWSISFLLSEEEFYSTDKDNSNPSSSFLLNKDISLNIHPNNSTRMKPLALPETATISSKPITPFAFECWFDDACILDMEYFVKTISSIKAKGVCPDLIGSIIVHYASKWLPGLSDNEKGMNKNLLEDSFESVTASWMKKRFFIETLVGILPPEKDSVPCNFLLRLLRIANMVGVEPAFRADLEKRVSWQLEQASLKELMIPAFSHTCGTLLDVELIIRLVKSLVNMDEAVKSGVALVKVAKLVDCYLAEAAVDANLESSEFITLAGALPHHARVTNDELYRAVDTYLKAHPGVSKQERKNLCRLIDSEKLSQQASLHAAQNERLPVRAVIQVMFSERTKLNNSVDWSGSFSGTRSPNPMEPPVRCLSKREITAQQMEVRRLREDIIRLQSQCNSMKAQIERIMEKKRGFFRWMKFGVPSFKPVSSSEKKFGVLSFNPVSSSEKTEEVKVEGEVGFEQRTPMDMRAKLVTGRNPPKWRKSMS